MIRHEPRHRAGILQRRIGAIGVDRSYPFGESCWPDAVRLIAPRKATPAHVVPRSWQAK